MLIPRYFYSNDYSGLYEYFLSCPHQERHFKKGDYLWRPGEYIEHVYYIKSGIAKTTVEHEDGYEKLFLFSSRGTVYPGCHESLFKIEKSIVTRAISDMDALEFRRKDFYRMFQENSTLNALVLESYAMFINLLIYESAHQEYNNTLVKLCNLLYLFSQNRAEEQTHHIDLTQEEIASILTINRVNVAKYISRLRNEGIIISHRKWIEIVDFGMLKEYCSMETQME